MTPEQRERAQRAADALDFPFAKPSVKEQCEAASLLRELLAKDSEDAKNAARYLWLRNVDNWSEDGPTPCVATCESVIYGEALDRAIDAAIAKEQK